MEQQTQDVAALPQGEPTTTEPDSLENAALDVLEAEAVEAEQPAKEEAKFRVKIDGTERDATLDELVAGFQKGTAAEERFRAAAEQRKHAEQLAQEAQAMRGQYQQRLDEFVPDQIARLQAMQAELNTLAQEDPAAWVMKKQAFDGELNKLHQAQAERQRISYEAQQAEQSKTAETLAREAAELVKAIPEWKDEARAKTEKAQIRQFLQSAGYDDKVIESITDHKAVLLTRKAMLYDSLMQKVASRKAKPAENTEAPAPSTEVHARGTATKDPERMSVDEWMRNRNKQVRAA